MSAPVTRGTIPITIYQKAILQKNTEGADAVVGLAIVDGKAPVTSHVYLAVTAFTIESVRCVIIIRRSTDLPKATLANLAFPNRLTGALDVQHLAFGT